MDEPIRLISSTKDTTPLSILASSEENKAVNIEGTSYLNNLIVKNIKANRIQQLHTTFNTLCKIKKTITQRHNARTFIVDNKCEQKIDFQLNNNLPFECQFIVSNSVIVFKFLNSQFDFSSFVISPSQIYTFFKKENTMFIKPTFSCGSANLKIVKKVTKNNKIKIHLSGTIMRENIIFK